MAGPLRFFALVALFIALGWSAPSASAQTAAERNARWTAHTSFFQATDVVVGGGRVWVATLGGVFSYDPESDGTFARYTVTGGLSSADTTALAYDSAREALWIGYGDGVLDRLDAETGAVQSFRDIVRADQFADRGINRLVMRGDTLYAATSFGVVVFDPMRGEVRAAYTRLGTLSPGVGVRDVLVAPGDSGPTLYVATDEGLAFAPMNAPNLQDPAVWTVERGGEAVRSLGYADASLYIGLGRDVYRRLGAGSYQRATFLDVPVRELVATEDGRLIGIAPSGLVYFRPGNDAGAVQGDTGLLDARAIALDGGTAWVADFGLALRGLTLTFPQATGTDPTVRAVQNGLGGAPNGPYHLRFSDLSSGPGGDVIASSFVTEPGGGTYYYDADQKSWRSFIARFEPGLQGRTGYSHAIIAADGSVWAAGEGGGVARIENPKSEQSSITLFDSANSSMPPVNGTSNFIIASDVVQLPRGPIVVGNRASTLPLHVYEEGEWTSLAPSLGGGLGSTSYGEIVADDFGQLWIEVRRASVLKESIGVLVRDLGRTPSDDSDDAFRFFGQLGAAGSGLPNVSVKAIVEDGDGNVWVGTERGLAYFINTGIVARDPQATAIWPLKADRVEGEDPYLLRGLSVNDLAADPAGRLWIAADDGARLIERVEEGGYRQVEHFTQANSPLFSDRVVAITVSGPTGEVYFATDRGMVSYQGNAVDPVPTPEPLRVYPNPAIAVEGVAPMITIDGLTDGTDVRIVTPDGTVVRRIAARGGRTQWDGLDENGLSVPSGVYLVVAAGTEGQGRAYGRVALIR